VQPVVANARGGDQRERHLELGTSWFQNPQEWAALPADDGPADWQRIDVQVDMTRRVGNEPLEPGRKVDIVVPVQNIEVHELPEISVSNVKMGDQDFSFDVSQIGVPVLVKMSYFPNWKVDGAEGPYRVSPNFMVVVPTDTHVYLHYDSSALDKAAYAITLLGIALLFFWRFKSGDVRHRTSHPFLGTPPDDEYDEFEYDEPGFDEPGFDAAGFHAPVHAVPVQDVPLNAVHMNDPAYDDTRFDMTLDPLLLPPPYHDEPPAPPGQPGSV
jgi:hypothetical protein